MKCVMCGGETDAGVRMTRPVDLSAPGVQLDDVMVRTCTSCGEEYYELPPLPLDGKEGRQPRFEPS